MLHPQMPRHGVSTDKIVNRQNAEALPTGEPTFILRASDPIALRALTAYLSATEDPKRAKAVAARIEDFKRFGREHPETISKMAPAPRTLQKRIGDVIRRHREATGLSQEAFADSIEMHRAQYSFIERGKRDIRLSTLQRLARGLKVPLWKILKEADEL